MARVNIHSDDVRRIAGMQFDRQVHSDFQFEAQMPRCDAERLQNVTPKCLDEAVADGQLRREANGMFDWHHVMDRGTTFISGGEIVMRWDCEQKKPAAFRGRAKLQREGGLGWSRTKAKRRMEKVASKMKSVRE